MTKKVYFVFAVILVVIGLSTTPSRKAQASPVNFDDRCETAWDDCFVTATLTNENCLSLGFTGGVCLGMAQGFADRCMDDKQCPHRTY
jgi:hypothetical protein